MDLNGFKATICCILLRIFQIYSKRAKLEKEQFFLNQNKYDTNTHSDFSDTESDPGIIKERWNVVKHEQIFTHKIFTLPVQGVLYKLLILGSFELVPLPMNYQPIQKISIFRKSSPLIKQLKHDLFNS